MNFEDIRNFLLKSGFYNTISALDEEKKLQTSKTPPNFEQTQANSNPVLNLSFGETDSNQQKEGSFRLDSQISTKNQIDLHFDKSNTQSNNASVNSQKKPIEQRNWTKSEATPATQKKELKDNPFDILTEINATDQKKAPALQNEEDRFSFGGENENENDFDSFSKSHNNKYSNNENPELEEQNVFGNSFDIKLDNQKNKKQAQIGTNLRNSKTGNRFSNDDEFLGQKTGLENLIKSENFPNKKLNIDKSDVKSIDEEVKLNIDLFSEANKRCSQGFGHIFGNNRGLAKKLFPGMEGDEIFTSGPPRPEASRHSNPERTTNPKPIIIKPEYMDEC